MSYHRVRSFFPIATVYANPVSMGGVFNGHYGGNAETYMNVGEAMGEAMVTLMVPEPSTFVLGAFGFLAMARHRRRRRRQNASI